MKLNVKKVLMATGIQRWEVIDNFMVMNNNELIILYYILKEATFNNK